MDDIEQHPINDSLDDPINESELGQALKNTELGKSSCPDGVLAEFLVNGGARLRAFLSTMVTIFWSTENIPTDLIDPNITILYKKGDRSLCGSYRGLSLLSVVGKIFAELIYAQSQSKYRSGRSIVDGIFTPRQLMENSREQRRNMYIAFVDFTKAFDTVSRDLLYGILGRLGCPAKFVGIIKKLHTNVHERPVVDGELTSPFEYNSGVIQGCKLAPTLYGIYAAVLLWLAYKDIKHTNSIQVSSRYDGDFFDLRRLKSKTKVLAMYIREAQYADDIAIFTDTTAGLQTLLTAYNDLAREMGLCINTEKSETMCIGPEAEYFIDQTKLKNVNRFKYLGSYVANDCSIEDGLTVRIQATSCAFGRLRHRVFDSHDLTCLAKVKVYNQCLMLLLMYGSETWTLNHQQVRQLRTVQQRHLRRILKINGTITSATKRFLQKHVGRYRNIISKKSTTMAGPCFQNGR